MVRRTPEDPWGWADIAGVQPDPFGVGQYMTPTFPGQVSDTKWNAGAALPYDIDTMSKQGNVMQDYYQIAADPVTQWMNMATTGGAPFDINALLGGAQQEPQTSRRLKSFLESDDEYLQAIGQQLEANVAPEVIKLQLLQEPDIANDDNLKALYSDAVDQGYTEMGDADKANSDAKLTGPLAEFQKRGLINPLETFNADNLPGDVAVSREAAGRLDKGRSSKGRAQVEDLDKYSEYYTQMASMLRAARKAQDSHKNIMGTGGMGSSPAFGKDGNPNLAVNRGMQDGGPAIPDQPGPQSPVFGSRGNPNLAVNRGANTGHIIPDEHGQAPPPFGTRGNPNLAVNRGGNQYLDPQAQEAAGAGDGTSYLHVLLGGDEAEYAGKAAAAKKTADFNRQFYAKNAAESNRNINAIRASQLARAGRTPAGEQAKSMMAWLRSQGYGA